MDDFAVLDMKSRVWTRLSGKYGMADPTAFHSLTAVSATRLVAIGGKRVGNGDDGGRGGGGGEDDDEEDEEEEARRRRRKKKKEKIKYISNKVMVYNVVNSKWSEEPEALPLVDFSSNGSAAGGIMAHSAHLVERKKTDSIFCLGGYEDEKHARHPEFIPRFDVGK